MRSIKADSFKVALDMTQATLEEKAPLEAPVRPLEKTLDIAGFIFEAEAATAGEDGKVRDLLCVGMPIVDQFGMPIVDQFSA